MNAEPDIIVIGTGPAGMAAATTAAAHGATVLALDEQRAPGGQIFRSIETNRDTRPELGDSYGKGVERARLFRDSAIDYVPGAVVWYVSPDREVGYSKDGSSRLVSGRQIIMTAGAQERPFPIPGWTLQGVMTAGAAQILLKEAEIGVTDAVFVGTGPLLYLIVHQYMQADIPVKAVLDLTRRANLGRALPHLPAAIFSGLAKLREGRGWKRDIAASNIPFIKDIDDVRIEGTDGLATGVTYSRKGRRDRIDCEHVLLHQGVVPNINASSAAGCDRRWDAEQLCWQVVVDDWFETTLPNIACAGDGAFIAGAEAARLSGCLAALGALARLGKIDRATRDHLARPCRQAWRAELRIRPFLDALFRPARFCRIPRDDDVIICRCEEVTLGQLHTAFAAGCAGPNQLKSFTRCGMGPCQSRFCGLTLSELVASMEGKPVGLVGGLRYRPPIKPLSLRELADLDLP